ncbi:MAG: AtpZ/AtpI family protein [Prolixibacteraceae bacterium]|jgi:F0F1-type ATP synthase assembly protein I|nr:AtpZ/AtpI family protein [Prolixibacteraceae bacterium]
MNRDKGQKPKKQFDDFIRYSSLAFEMVAIMGIGVWIGVKIDQWLDLGFPAFTLGLMILSVVGAVYHAIRKFL